MAIEVTIQEVKTHTLMVNTEDPREADLTALAYVAGDFNDKTRVDVEHLIESSKAEASFAVLYAINYSEDGIDVGNIQAIV